MFVYLSWRERALRDLQDIVFTRRGLVKPLAVTVWFTVSCLFPLTVVQNSLEHRIALGRKM